MNASNPLELLDSPLHRQWREDRAHRQGIRTSERWRGCLGLGLLLDPATPIHSHGPHRFCPNAALTWLAMRDVPVGQWYVPPTRVLREVVYVTSTVAQLRYGMPRIDFSQGARHAIDFRLCPFGQIQHQSPEGRWRQITARGDVLNSDNEPRIFGVLNQLSMAMTRLAHTAVMNDGTPVRPPWFARRPVKECQYPTLSPRDWFPRPYVGLDRAALDTVRAMNPKLAVPLASQPNRVYWPAYAVARIVRDVPPVDLIWDLAPSFGYFDADLHALALPPLRLGAWDRLRLNLAEVDFNAQIDDSRINVERPRTPAYSIGISRAPLRRRVSRNDNAKPVRVAAGESLVEPRVTNSDRDARGRVAIPA